MSENTGIPLIQLDTGQSGVVTQIDGGHSLINRLGAMGIIPGRKITKVSSMFMRGPVTIQVANTQLAIDFGMARRIFIKPR